tara:strand:- start:1019 stop:1396 length:378 start_codon:yes stop_codon:yes gene_type:complete
MKKTVISLAILLFGTMPSMAYEYPTEATVHYILNCMAALGGQTDQNLYTCSCRYDSIREVLSFDDYSDGRTYERNKAMPGKKGGFFRDNERGEGLYNVLVKAREQAAEQCIVVTQVKMIKPTSSQ